VPARRPRKLLSVRSQAFQTTGKVKDALASAGIPESNVGPCRGEQLSAAERELYVWMLRGFGCGKPPSADAIRAHATCLGLDPDHSREKLATEDLVHFDGDGEITVAYPFSGRPTRHRVRIEGHMVFAMCAIDALGIAPMFERAIAIDSSDLLTNAVISIWLQPDGTATWQPNEAVVVTGRACADGAAFQGCCQVLNFFASLDNAERYLSEREDVSGFPITMPQAVEVGRAVFGAVLKEN
jgi:Alkylmercury lyase